jgi:hypothetical protein
VKYFLECTFQLILVPAGNENVGSGLGQGTCHGFAQAFAAAGDEGYFSL